MAGTTPDKMAGDREGVVAPPSDPQVDVRSEAMLFLRAMMDAVRPDTDHRELADSRMQALIARIDSDPAYERAFRSSFAACIRGVDLGPLIVESGMAVSRSLGKELYRRIKHKLLPPLQDAHDFLRIIDTVFHQVDDYQWVERIDRDTWLSFFSRLRLSMPLTSRLMGGQVLRALGILSIRVASLGCEREVADYLPARLSGDANPFLRQQAEMAGLASGATGTDHLRGNHVVSSVRSSLNECFTVIRYIRYNTAERGAGLSQTFLLYQIERLLERMVILFDIIDGDEHVDGHRFVDYFVRVVRNQNRKYSLREFLSHTTGYLAYQIAEQKGRKGDSYITTTPKEYRFMLFSAMKGGFIVSFVAVFKNLLSAVHAIPVWQGFLYSVNYAAGFVLIDRTGSTLATKQPAFTANAVAGSIETNREGGDPNFRKLAETVAKVSRSQIASFLGNLIVVFPATFLLAWAFDHFLGYRIAEGGQAMSLLTDQHPTGSLSLLYACNTGVFLFLSGIIAGYVQNKMRYARIAERMVRHPYLSRTLRPARLERIAAFWDRNAGMILGSVALGFLLGMASVTRSFLGLPIDIRHITISAGNVAIGAYGIGLENIPGGLMAATVSGVLLIGTLNFLVSFSISFYVAVRSRGLRFRKDFAPFSRELWGYFRRHPLDFIRPPRTLLQSQRP